MIGVILREDERRRLTKVRSHIQRDILEIRLKTYAPSTVSVRKIESAMMKLLCSTRKN
jgi:hypothetical protein